MATFLLAILAALATLTLTLKRPVWAVAAVVALLPTYLIRFTLPFPGLNLPSTLLEFLWLGLFGGWFVTRGLRHGDAWRGLSRWRWPIALLLIAATVSLLVSPDWRAAAGVWRAYFLEPILFFVVFTDTIRTPADRRLILTALGATMSVVGIIAIDQKITGWGIPNPIWQAEATRRVTAFYGFPNAIGLFAAPVTVLMAGWCVSLWRRSLGQKAAGTQPSTLPASPSPLPTPNSPLPPPRWLLPLAAALLGGLAMLFAVSEGAIIGTLAGLLTLGLLIKPLRAWALGAIIAACLVVILWAPATRHAVGIFNMNDDSTSVRAVVWNESWRMLRDRPVFGAGLAGYQSWLAAYHTSDWVEIFMYPHNIILNFWSETGLAGLIAFFWLVIHYFVNAGRLIRRAPNRWLAPALVAAIVAILVHGLVDVPYFKNDLAIEFWVMIGLMESLLISTAATPQAASPGVDK